MPTIDDDSTDLDSALAALRRRDLESATQGRSSRASHRATLGLALCGLLLGGIFAVATAGQESRPDSVEAGQSDDVYLSAHPGSCLLWQPDEASRPSFVQCTTPHLFEVAGAAGDTSEGHEPCDLTVRKYLGVRFDPNSKFHVTELSPTEGSRNALCGLELTGPDGRLLPFRGQVSQSDQSKMWPPGTCRGVDAKTDQPTDTAVDCAGPHSLEVIGAVDLGERFGDTAPSDVDQTAALDNSCTRLAGAYLAPRSLASTGLSVVYHAITPASWNAGSRHAACALGSRQSGTVIGPAKSQHAPESETPSAPSEPAPSPETTTPERPARTAPETTAPERPNHPASETEPGRATPETTAAPTVSNAGGSTTDGVVQVPASGHSPAHEVVTIPGLAPITMPVLPEEPGGAPVPLTP